MIEEYILTEMKGCVRDNNTQSTDMGVNPAGRTGFGSGVNHVTSLVFIFFINKTVIKFTKYIQPLCVLFICEMRTINVPASQRYPEDRVNPQKMLRTAPGVYVLVVLIAVSHVASRHCFPGGCALCVCVPYA